MRQSAVRILLCFLLTLLALYASTHVQAQAAEKKRDTPAAPANAEQVTRDILAKFDQGNPGWKVRMEALVGLAKIGPSAAPVLADALKAGSGATREFAAQALVLFADPNTRPALEQALADPKSGVRIHAIQALGMLGPLARTETNERILMSDPSRWGARPMMAAALERDDKPNAPALRKALADYDLRSLDSARIGELAPDFILTNFDGKTYRLSDFRGKTVVLRFILFDF